MLEKTNQRMANRGKLATLGTQDKNKQNKKNHNIICAGHHYKQTQIM
jgi:hypothetical protein